MADVHYFGIRHHGPGSAKRLLAALEKLQPSAVLVEGPADCSDLFPQLANPQMKPPVALLSYVADNATCSTYYPFAEYSPEYQACCWAVENSVALAFMDLPIAVRLAMMMKESGEKEQEGKELPSESEDGESSDGSSDENPAESADEESDEKSRAYAELAADPIGVLARCAGYEDGEAWWNDLIEQNSDDDEAIFATVELAMSELRCTVESHADASSDPQFARDLPREAFMRLEIASAAKNTDGPIAVVCGAWHVPALKEKHTAKDDRALLKTLPAKLAASKVKSTWVPWTSPRLATSSGYGAGVSAPMWYQHIWQQRHNPKALEHWLGGITREMRNSGHIVSTASVIEAVRLSSSLASVRSRPSPGFEEIREAVVACLCFGEALVWQNLEQRILLGNEVGTIPPDAPLVPLLEDLQRQQKKHKLKPEALERELSLDLRSNAGAGKSVLLHRLNILGVPWGQLSDAGRSRGTFRERWVLSWQPEFSVNLVENLVYGSTIEHASEGKISEALNAENHLNKLAEAVQLCLEAQLDKAADLGLKRLDDRAAHASDCIELLESLPPLINISRYGTARNISLDHIQTLSQRLATQTAIALPYACRNLNDEESQHYRQCVSDAHQAVLLAEMDADLMETWWQALHSVVQSAQSSLQISGLCARLMYQADRLEVEELQVILQRMLSPALPAADAARFFEGFFAGAVQRLLYDDVLLQAVEQWLIALDSEEFVEFLPLFRRIFSGLDSMERKRMINAVLQGRDGSGVGNQKINPETVPLWSDHLARLNKLIEREKDWTQ